MIARDTDVSIEFTCQPITAGYSTGDHVCTWRFSGSAETQTGTTVSHAWTTGGLHRATVTAVNAAAGTSATASIPLLITKQPSILDPTYILIDKPAAALTRNAIYYLDGADIHLWDPDADTDVVYSDLPNSTEIGDCDTPPTFEGIEVSNDYLHAHYSTTTHYTNSGYTPPTGIGNRLVSLRRRLDVTDNWTIYEDVSYFTFFNNWWRLFGPIAHLSFASGNTWAVGELWNSQDPPVQESYRNRISGEGSYDATGYGAAAGIYYASFDRSHIGNTMGSNGNSIAIAEGFNYYDVRLGTGAFNRFQAKINLIGSIPWLFYQSGTTLHVCRESVPVHSPRVYLDTALSERVMSTVFTPVPFGTESLVVLAEDAASGANAVWWNGTEFTEEYLGDADRSSLVPVLFSPGLVFARTGKMFSLADGSLLHCLS